MLQLIARLTFIHSFYSKFVRRFPVFFYHNNSKYFTIKKILYNLNLDQIEGDIIEFGLFTGSSFRHIIQIEKKYNIKTKYYGLDSFEGFPDSSHPFFLKNTFIANYKKVKKIEKIVPNYIKIYKGFFNEVLSTNSDFENLKFKFVHLDCDLYISSIDPLNYLKGRLVNGAYVMIDDFTNLDNEKNSIRNALEEVFNIQDFEKTSFFGVDGVVLRYLPKIK